ncbi:MAG: M20/M25/M40 family metallo-hydrolase [Tissierellia bacterium]|nr:M20/M25/M40 family metallo-hydrolase [Tissierellia bacterium]
MFDLENAVENLSQAIQFKTISYADYDRVDYKIYDEFLDFLKNSYPNVHRVCKLEMLNEYCPVYILESETKGKKPILLLGHYDVVPVGKTNEAHWEEEPFSGAVKDGFIWGRGTLDDKNQVIAVMEAIEHTISEDIKFDRDIYMVFGFDEEVGGKRGAEKAAEVFKERNIQFECVLDEGGAIITDMLEGLTAPLALVGTAEKGSNNIRITVKGKDGHSSMPPMNTAVGTLAKLITNVEKTPMPARLISPVKDMFQTMAPYVTGKSFILKNTERLFPFIQSTLAKDATTNSLIRTTIAFTMIEGSQAANVLPKTASAIANVRVLQGDSLESAIEHIRKVNPNIEFEVEKLLVEEPSEISNVDADSYKILTQTINKIYPEAVALPYLMVGGTDSRKYFHLCENIYRFSAVILSKTDFDTIHSNNEKISIQNFSNMIKFYIEFLSNYLSS